MTPDENLQHLKAKYNEAGKMDTVDFFRDSIDPAPKYRKLMEEAPLVADLLIEALPSSPSASGFDEKIGEIMEIASAQSEIQQEEVLAKVRAKTKISISLLRRHLKGVQRKGGVTESDGEFKTIEVSGTTPPDIVLTSIVEALKGVGNFYRYANALSLADGEGFQILHSPERMQGATVDKLRFFRRNEERPNEPFFELFPVPFAKALPHSIYAKQLPELVFHARHPILGVDFGPLAPGYHPEIRAYVGSQPVTPSMSHCMLHELLGDFCFATEADRTNHVAFLLTTLVHHLFASRVPMEVLKGTQPGLGKGELAETLAILREGRECPNITFIPNEEEFEKRICGELLSGLSTLKIDNAKTHQRIAPVIESAVLERTITDATPAFRILGANERLVLPINRIQVTLTFNGGELSRDLISRSVPVNLSHEGDPGLRTFKYPDIRKFTREHRTELFAELLGMFAKWKQAGMPRAKVAHRMREWAEVIGGVLEINGFKGFLSNIEEFRASSDSARADLAVLMEHMDVGRKYKAGELLGKAGGLFSSELAERRDAAGLGRILARYIDQGVEVSGTFRYLRSRRIQNSSSYWVELGGSVGGNPPNGKVIKFN